jgi:hypothetical protein
MIPKIREKQKTTRNTHLLEAYLYFFTHLFLFLKPLKGRKGYFPIIFSFAHISRQSAASKCEKKNAGCSFLGFRV